MNIYEYIVNYEHDTKPKKHFYAEIFFMVFGGWEGGWYPHSLATREHCFTPVFCGT